MPVIIHPPGRKLPPNHPFAQPRIIFGMKPPPGWEKTQGQPGPDAPPSGEDMVDSTRETTTQDKADKPP